MASQHELGGDAPASNAREADVTARPERAADVAKAGGERRWTPLAEAELLRDLAREGQARFAFLAEASRWLAKSLDYESTLATVAGLALPQFGAWCIVDVCESDGTIRRLAVIHPNPDKQALARELHRCYPPAPDDPVGAPRVIRRREPEIMLDVPDEALAAIARDPEHLTLLRGLGLRSYMIVPMVARDRVVGAITFVTADAERCYGTTDLILAEDLALRCAMAIDNARLYREAELARAEAEAANEAKAAFVTTLSHELRAPLQAMAGHTALLVQDLHSPLTDIQREGLAAIDRGQRHLLGLIRELLNYAQIQAGRVQFELADIQANEVLAETQALMAPMLAWKGLACQPIQCDPSIVVRADRVRLNQILINLLSNAVKFTDRGGTVTLMCEQADGMVAIRVSDTGGGIPTERTGAIFEPFSQIPAGSWGATEGTGLGLAISQELARGMGGDLGAESVPGRGSTFTLTLPRAV